jgi:sRNA-binding carbon storage regulator CsrA
MIVVNRKDGDIIFLTLPSGERIEILIQKERHESVKLLLNLPKAVKLSQVTSAEKCSSDRFNPEH